ncbi:hypothetical protein CXQ85_000481 [Candidozyma haemuli]|uniref:Uncharacterized protein n=1 Tax=Candidozyma haemuli TaxID=45357 RepID=A0A2V1ATT9_9ASCO|nr:hypothetical protein CXQ85_000481 [[Candida] haemuloni]PVH21500.1 hypothetical protein CXQ85_000481 [[Candida] haemuloni]
MCLDCRKFGIIEVPRIAISARFFMDGSVEVNHGASTVEIAWKSIDEFIRFHTIMMVGRSNPLASSIAQNTWAAKLDEFEYRYNEVEKVISRHIRQFKMPRHRHGYPKSIMDKAAAEREAAAESDPFRFCFRIEEGSVFSSSASPSGQSIFDEKEPEVVPLKPSIERTEEPPRKIYGLPEPRSNGKLSKNRKRKLAKTKREAFPL